MKYNCNYQSPQEGQLFTVCVDHFVLPNHHCPVTMVFPSKPFIGEPLQDSDLGVYIIS